jgi:hypothetical protein
VEAASMTLADRAPAPWRDGLTWDSQGALEGRRERFDSLDITSGNPRGDIYQAVIGRYRKPRKTPRTDIGGHVMEDCAPDWLWMLAHDVLEHTRLEPDHGRSLLEQAIAWCEAGDEEARSERIRDPEPVAPSRGAILDAAYVGTMKRFLIEAWKAPGYLAKNPAAHR